MIALAYVAVCAGREDRVSSATQALFRRRQDADISGIRDQFRISASSNVPLAFARARRRAIFHSADVICRSVRAARVFCSFDGSVIYFFRVNHVKDVTFYFGARYFSFLLNNRAIFISRRVHRYSVYALYNRFRYSHLAGAAYNPHGSYRFAFWWFRVGSILGSALGRTDSHEVTATRRNGNGRITFLRAVVVLNVCRY